MKKSKIIIFLVIILFLITSCTNNQDKEKKLTIISTSYPGYDFARAIAKNSNFEVKMLMKPGSETHDYDPTPKDVVDINNCDIFIYVGGESDFWVNDILDDIENDNVKIIRLMDIVDILDEEHIEGMEEEKNDIEPDEHIWTSPINAIDIVKKIEDEIIKIDEANKEIYENNANEYIEELEKIDSEIREIVSNSKRKELIFGDRFPFLYFTKEYGLTYYAAFSGCSEQSEASSKTISFLVNKVKEDKIKVILKLELSNGNIASTIAKETNTKVLEFHSAHNITQKDFDSGVTYVDIMKKNIEVLKEALN